MKYFEEWIWIKKKYKTSNVQKSIMIYIIYTLYNFFFYYFIFTPISIMPKQYKWGMNKQDRYNKK